MAAMQEKGVAETNIYVDKQSGKDFNRPKYVELSQKLEKGDLCSCRFLILSRSDSATNDRICSTRSAINVPIKSLPCLVYIGLHVFE